MQGFIDKIDWINIEPMKYWSFTNSTPQEKRKEIIKNSIFSLEYVGALKVDGYYQRIIKDEDGNCFMIARSRNVKGETVNKIEWVPQLNDWLDSLPNGTCLLCECYLPNNEGSNKITTILGCLKEKAIARQQNAPLNIYVFDIMAFNGQNFLKTPFIERIKYLNKISSQFVSEYVQYAQYFEGQELWERIQDYLSSGREGVVIMRKDAIVYQKRTPARVSIKIKKELQETLDVVILDAVAPTRMYGGKDIINWQYWEDTRTGQKLQGALYKQYSDGASIEPVTKNYWNGWAGSLVIGAKKGDKLVVVGALSGLTEEILSDWKKYKGCVAEITGMQVFGETNGIRHPKFVQWRPDLSASDTDWYRIFGEK